MTFGDQWSENLDNFSLKFIFGIHFTPGMLSLEMSGYCYWHGFARNKRHTSRYVRRQFVVND